MPNDLREWCFRNRIEDVDTSRNGRKYIWLLGMKCEMCYILNLEQFVL
jgi:hypothetical protein